MYELYKCSIVETKHRMDEFQSYVALILFKHSLLNLPVIIFVIVN